ncbi:MAG: hypothetical protein ACTHLH_07750 [Solirubrobacterales bacterium]
MLLLAALGLYGIFDELLVWWLPFVVVFVVGIVVGFSIVGRNWGYLGVALSLLAAALVALLALVGFDVALNAALKALHHIHPLHDIRVPVWAGLILAVTVVTAAAWWYLHRLCFSNCVAIGSGAALAFLGVLVTPVVVGSLNAGTEPVSNPKPIASTLSMLIVTDGRHHPRPIELQPIPALSEFTVHYSVGVAEGDGVRWTLVDSESEREAVLAAAEGSRRAGVESSPVAAGKTDSVLVLLVDGTDPVVTSPAKLPNRPPQSGEVRRWSRVAAAATASAPKTPAFALLQSTDAARLQQWKRWRAGTAVSMQALESQVVTDAAFRLAVSAPESQADFLLAERYRPILLFDREEEVPWPLSIRAMFERGWVQLCRDEGLKTKCPGKSIANPDELQNGSTSLKLSLPDSEELQKLAQRELKRAKAEAEAPQLGGKAEASVPEATPPAATVEPPVPGAPAAAAAPLEVASAIYVNPVTRKHPWRLYLDYWWYLPENPVELGGGALCGAGLVIAGVTCDNHQSDWEGMTVVLAMRGGEARPVAVQYAQHDGVVRYSWPMLQRLWARSRAVRKRIAGIDDAESRPLAFSARGTHATYPRPCADCGQVKNWALGEEPHRGNLPWAGDYSGACGHLSCLQLLPTRHQGSEPASWNAYENPWGELDCFLVYYCDSGTPPRSPGQQGRYQHPAHHNGEVGADGVYHSTS